MGPARFHCATLLFVLELGYHWDIPTLENIFMTLMSRKESKLGLSAVRFELTPTEVDCDLNAAP